MKQILVNDIKKQVLIKAHQSGKNPKEIIQKIEEKYFSDRPKYFGRLLNNTSQPTLEEAASIAAELDANINDLLVFQSETATV